MSMLRTIEADFDAHYPPDEAPATVRTTPAE
jgi:hypothetical protein